MRLEHAERGEPEGVQVLLEAADVLLPDAQVVQQVARAVVEVRLDGVELAGVDGLERERPLAQGAQRREGTFE